MWIIAHEGPCLWSVFFHVSVFLKLALSLSTLLLLPIFVNVLSLSWWYLDALNPRRSENRIQNLDIELN